MKNICQKRKVGKLCFGEKPLRIRYGTKFCDLKISRYIASVSQKRRFSSHVGWSE